MAKQNLYDIRNVYAILTDILHKNIGKVRALRILSSVSHTHMVFAAPIAERQQRYRHVLRATEEQLAELPVQEGLLLPTSQYARTTHYYTS